MDYLEHLAALLGQECLSDLHWRAISRQQAEAVLAEPLDRPEREYLDAARYVLGPSAFRARSPQAARQAIVDELLRR